MYCPKISPNCFYIAVNYANELKITSLDQIERYSIKFKDKLNNYEWSPDSNLLYGLFLEKHMIKVWRLDDLSWNCTIYETFSGCRNVVWSPDSRHLVVILKNLCRANIWSLSQKNSLMYIKNVKCQHFCVQKIVGEDNANKYNKTLTFSNDNTMLAVLEDSCHTKIRDSNDKLSIFFVENKDSHLFDWRLNKIIQLKSNYCEALQWSSEDQFICVQESYYRGVIYIYQVSNSQLLKTIDCNLLRNNVITSSLIPACPTTLFCDWTNANSLFLLVTYFPNTIILFNHVTWEPMFCFQSPKVLKDDTETLIHEEMLVKEGLHYDIQNLLKEDEHNGNTNHIIDKKDGNKLDSLLNSTDEKLSNVSVELRKQRDRYDTTLDITLAVNGSQDSDKKWESSYCLITKRPYVTDSNYPNTQLTQTTYHLPPKFSYDNRYLVSCDEATPSIVFIWNIEIGSLVHILVHRLPVYDYAWNPRRNLLVICTGSRNCFLWTPQSCAVYMEEKNLTLITYPDGQNDESAAALQNEGLKKEALMPPKHLDIPIHKLQWSPKGNELFAMSGLLCEWFQPKTEFNGMGKDDIPFRIIKFSKDFWKKMLATSKTNQQI